MKIVISDCYHDSDRGGTGILIGLIEYLHVISEKIGQPIELSIIYRIHNDDRRFKSATRHISKQYPKINIFSYPIKTERRYSGILKVFEVASLFFLATFKLLFPCLSKHPTVLEIKNADLVIHKGGQFYRMVSPKSFRGFFQAFFSYYVSLLCISLKKRFIFLSHTFGPFNNNGARFLTKYVLKRASYVGCREAISCDILIKLGLSLKNLDVLPDTAFALPPESQNKKIFFEEKYKISMGSFVVFIGKKWSFPGNDEKNAQIKYDKYIAVMARAADYFAAQLLKVLLVVHNDGLHSPQENDAVPIRDIYKKIKQKDKVLIVSDDLSSQEQSLLYGMAHMVIATRLHAAIFALISGSPCISISYTHKTDGIMKMVGIDNYVLDIANLKYDNLKTMIDRLNQERDKVMNKVKARIELLRKELLMKIENIVFVNKKK